MSKSSKPSPSKKAAPSKPKPQSKPVTKPTTKVASKPAAKSPAPPKAGPPKAAAAKSPAKPAAIKGAKPVPASPAKATTPEKKAAAPAKGGPAKPAPAATPSPAPKPGKKPDAAAPGAPAANGKPMPAAPGPAPAAASPAPGAPAVDDGKKIPPKGITVVQNRPMRKPKPKKLEMPILEPLLKPGNRWKPLIPSGPKAPPTGLVGAGKGPTDTTISSKNRLNKKELDKYREVLLHKRSELVGDVTNIEDEALRQNSGSLSSLPQHLAEQGSDTSDQSISLDLAQVDRNMIREIDEALRRIDDGSYGVCLRTGQRISAERLAEIPWAKYSIEAQRELESRSFQQPG